MDFAQIWVGMKLTGPRGSGAGAPPRKIVTGPCGASGPRETPSSETRLREGWLVVIGQSSGSTEPN